MTKRWIPVASAWLTQSLEPVPHELNELDWKAALSGSKDRLAEHLIAFANYPNGGFLVFGIRDSDAALVGQSPWRLWWTSSLRRTPVGTTTFLA